MKNWTKFTVGSLGLIGSGIGLAIWKGGANWNSETDSLVAKIKEKAIAKKSEEVSFKEFDELPVPVARYFRLVLKEGRPLVKTARLRQTGKFFINENWIPFNAIQHFSADPHYFVWDAEMKMNSFLNVRVRDAFVDGEGSMKAKVLSLIPVMDISGNKKLLAGALQRYLAEAVWFPTALLPGDKLRWSEIDENRALATLTESGTTVSLEFRFNEMGEITEVFSPARFRETDGGFVHTPWGGKFGNYEERNGMRIPLEGEVKWYLPEGEMPYWRGKIIRADFEFGNN